MYNNLRTIIGAQTLIVTLYINVQPLYIQELGVDCKYTYFQHFENLYFILTKSKICIPRESKIPFNHLQG